MKRGQGDYPKNPAPELEFIAEMMDYQFRIPFTRIRFGLDAIFGLVPGIGDLSTLAMSGYMIVMMANKGVSGNVLARMLLNVFIDSAIGTIPVVGDIFDVFFQANKRNYRLLIKHHQEGKFQGGARRVVIPVLICMVIFFTLIIYGAYKLADWAFS